MNGRDDRSRPGPDFPPGRGRPAADADLVEQGGRQLAILRRRPPAVVMLAAMALLAGLVLGYAAGDWHAGTSAAQPARSRTSAAAAGSAVTAGPALIQSGSLCSAQLGRALQLGVQVTNQSAAGAFLTAAARSPDLPGACNARRLRAV